jgi:hypothetical protein
MNNSTKESNAIQYFNLFIYTNIINKIINAANIGLLAEEQKTVKIPINIPKIGLSNF